MPTTMPTPDITKPQSASGVSAVPLVAPEESTAKRGFIAQAVAKAAEGQTIDPGRKCLMIAEAAYYHAEKRGFAPGGELQDWLEAESEVTALLR